MNTVQFPSCCGAEIFHNLIFLGNEQFTKELETLTALAKSNKRGIIFAITVPTQTEQTRLLRQNGFTIIKKFPNPNTNLTELTLWALDLANFPQKTISKVYAFLTKQLG